MTIIDSGPLDKKYYYFSADTSLKYNFGTVFVAKTQQNRINCNAGLGFYQVENSNMTLTLVVVLYGG